MNPKRTAGFATLAFKCLTAFLMLAFAAVADAQTLQTLCSFNGINGMNPVVGLTLGSDGNFYGATHGVNIGGGYGSVFQVRTNGTLTTLVFFDYWDECPLAALTLGNDGNLYGTTYKGGAAYGSVFKMTTNGTLTRLVSFNWANGAYPKAALTLGNDGNFYGTTDSGGSIGAGTVFKVTTNGTLTTLASFANWTNVNGAGPSALTLGNDGNFYGTTTRGGNISSLNGGSGWGTMFRVTTDGTMTMLYAFVGGTNGGYPYAGLTLGKDGNFYGTTGSGGITNSTFPSGMGTVFQVTTNGTFTTLAAFANTNANGAGPSGLTLGNDGNFYGTTWSGGITNSTFPSGMGTVFRVTTNGTLITLVSFNTANGAYPQAALTLGNDGHFYGTTVVGGASNVGTVFRLLLSPIITLQPQSQTYNAGSTVAFLVNATMLLDPTVYQWQKNGTNLVDGGNISGATTNMLTITAISDSDAATYSVIVSNADGSVTSSNVTLTVVDPPSITAQPSSVLVLAGTNVAFGVSLTGSAPLFRYQWQFNGTNILNATGASYTIPSVGTNDAGNYSVVITNPAGSVTSSNAALTVVLSPKSQTNRAGTTAAFTVTAFSLESLNYQWQKNGTNLDDGGNISGATNGTLTIASVSDADAGIYSAVVSDGYGSVTTSNATLTVNDLPFLTTQPQSQIVLAGSNVTFSAAAYGAPPLVFQWYFNGSPLGSPTSGTNFSAYTLSEVGTNESGNYSVKVVNGYSSATSSNAALTVVASPPAIISQPTNRTNNTGTTATFLVAASSVSPMAYQWQKNNTNLVNGGKISGATNSTLTITAVSSNEAAIYSVTITNLAGSVTSSNATLTVITPPGITAQPLAQQVLLGSSVSFTVTLSGTAPFGYRWRLNAANIPNATNAVYSIPAVGTNNAGNYSVVVTNPAGSVTSSNALLTVIVPPSLALQLWAGYPLLNLSGMLNSNFVVEYSGDVTDTNWVNLLSITNLPFSPYLFLDPAGVVEPTRFYRAFMQ